MGFKKTTILTLVTAACMSVSVATVPIYAAEPIAQSMATAASYDAAEYIAAASGGSWFKSFFDRLFFGGSSQGNSNPSTPSSEATKPAEPVTEATVTEATVTEAPETEKASTEAAESEAPAASETEKASTEAAEPEAPAASETEKASSEQHSSDANGDDAMGEALEVTNAEAIASLTSRITSAENVSRTLSGKIASFEERLAQLEEYKRQAEKNFEEMDSELAKTEGKVTSAEQLLKEVNNKLSDASGNIDTISSKLSAVEEKVKNMAVEGTGSEEVSELSRQMEALERRVASIAESSDENSERIIAIEGSMGTLEKLVKTIVDDWSQNSSADEEELNNVSQKLETLKNTLAIVETRLAKLEASDAASAADSASVAASISAAKNRIDELETQAANLADASSEERRNISNITKRLSEVEDALLGLNDGSGATSADVSVVSGKIASIEDDIKALSDSISTNKTSLRQLSSKIEDAESKLVKASDNISAIEKKILSDEANIGLVAESVEAVQQEIAAAVARIASVEERVASGEERLLEAEKKISETEGRFASVDERLDEAAAALSAKEQELLGLQKKVEVLESQLNDLSTTASRPDTSRYLDVTKDFGDYNLDNTGDSDVSGNLNYILNDLWTEVAGHTLFFPAGAYRFDNPVVCANGKVDSGQYIGRYAGVTLLGESQFGTEFRFNCENGMVPLTFNNGHRIRLFSISFFNDSNNSADMVLFESQCFDTYVNDCRFLNCIRGLHIKDSMYSYVYQTHFDNGLYNEYTQRECVYELFYENGEYGYIDHCSFEGKWSTGPGVGAKVTNCLLIFFDKIDFCNWKTGSAVQINGAEGYNRGSGSVRFNGCVFMRNSKSIDIEAGGTGTKGVYNIDVSQCAFTTCNEVRNSYILYAPNPLVRGIRFTDSYVYGSDNTGVKIKLPDNFTTGAAGATNVELSRFSLLVPSETKLSVEPAELADIIKSQN